MLKTLKSGLYHSRPAVMPCFAPDLVRFSLVLTPLSFVPVTPMTPVTPLLSVGSLNYNHQDSQTKIIRTWSLKKHISHQMFKVRSCAMCPRSQDVTGRTFSFHHSKYFYTNNRTAL